MRDRSRTVQSAAVIGGTRHTISRAVEGQNPDQQFSSVGEPIFSRVARKESLDDRAPRA
jgi:hypothetical protein